MGLVTFQVVEGMERGRVYADLPTPITLGREEENAIRLNDERVSRFHAKVQSDGDRVILTDLQSTNGTRVNGHPIQMRVLRIGDQVTIGRSVLIFGSREEIATDIARSAEENSHAGDFDSSEKTLGIPGRPTHSSENKDDILKADDVLELFPQGPPAPPEDLNPRQRAELSDYFSYVHEQISRVLQATIEEPIEGDEIEKASVVMRIDRSQWQRLLQLQMDIAGFLRQLTDTVE
ncbi:MAG: FHA domain-containing protein [Planctomycetaceae bacterium]